MKNLLQSDFYRLFKSKSYYICALVAILLFGSNIFLLDWSLKTLSKSSGMPADLPYKDGISYGLTVFSQGNVLMIIAIFISIFVIAEFSHGTMKNTISKGFHKLKVYLSKLITMTAAAFLLFLVTFFVGVVSGTIVTGNIGDLTGDYVSFMFKNTGIELLLNLALIAVLTMVAMIVRNLGGAIAIDLIGVLSLESVAFQALEFLFDGKIKFSQFSLMQNISFYYMNQTAAGADYFRSAIVGLAFLVIATVLGIFVFKKADVK
jgi:ABC-2 type transport system permease protein